VFIAASLLLTIFAANRVLYTTATTLSFEGRELGTVASEAEAQAAVKNVESSISQKLGSRYSLSPESLSYTTGVAYRGALVEEADLEEALSDSLRVVEKNGYEPEGLAREYLYINGRWEDHLHMVKRNQALRL